MNFKKDIVFDYPKQFIDVLGCGKSLLQLTVERFGDICPPENVWVLTSEKYASLVKEQLPMIADENILLEPCRRNTAPCIAYAAWKIKKRDPNANMVDVGEAAKDMYGMLIK